MTDVAVLHRRACELFASTVSAIRSEQWNAPTPGVDWTVREPVGHVVGEDLYRSSGAIGPRAQVADDADAPTRLLATIGRSPDWTPQTDRTGRGRASCT